MAFFSPFRQPVFHFGDHRRRGPRQIVGALMANGLPAYDAARLGAFVHGAAGERCGRGCIADDLPAAAAAVIAEIENGLINWEKTP